MNYSRTPGQGGGYNDESRYAQGGSWGASSQYGDYSAYGDLDEYADYDDYESYIASDYAQYPQAGQGQPQSQAGAAQGGWGVQNQGAKARNVPAPGREMQGTAQGNAGDSQEEMARRNAWIEKQAAGAWQGGAVGSDAWYERHPEARPESQYQSPSQHSRNAQSGRGNNAYGYDYGQGSYARQRSGYGGGYGGYAGQNPYNQPERQRGFYADRVDMAGAPGRVDSAGSARRGLSEPGDSWIGRDARIRINSAGEERESLYASSRTGQRTGARGGVRASSPTRNMANSRQRQAPSGSYDDYGASSAYSAYGNRRQLRPTDDLGDYGSGAGNYYDRGSGRGYSQNRGYSRQDRYSRDDYARNRGDEAPRRRTYEVGNVRDDRPETGGSALASIGGFFAAVGRGIAGGVGFAIDAARRNPKIALAVLAVVLVLVILLIVKTVSAAPASSTPSADVATTSAATTSAATTSTAATSAQTSTASATSTASSDATTSADTTSDSTTTADYEGVDDPWVEGGKFTTGDATLDKYIKEHCDSYTSDSLDYSDNAFNAYCAAVWMDYVEGDDNQDPEGEDWDIQYAKQLFEKGSGNCYEFAAAGSFILRYFGYSDAKADPYIVELQSGNWGDHGLIMVTNIKTGEECLCDSALGANGWMLARDSYNYKLVDIGQYPDSDTSSATSS